MKKALTILFTILSSVLIAGIYGVVHDQVTYSISSEYYTNFKFIQFNIADTLRSNERLGAGIIGFLATWWTGIPVGVVLGLYGVWKPKNIFTFRIKLNSVFVAMFTVVVFGVIGYIHGLIYTSGIEDWPVNMRTGNANMLDGFNQITDWRSFKIVGFIHNYGYLGGLFGLIFGCVYQFKRFKKS